MSYFLHQIQHFLDTEYPPSSAEEWDNVGLLVGWRDAPVRRVLTCLTVTPEVCDEAVAEKIDLIVSHHPFPFHSLRRVTDETIDGQMLLKLVAAGIAVYSPHTAHDSAPDGVNRQLATLFDLLRALNKFIDDNKLETLSDKSSMAFGPLLHGAAVLRELGLTLGLFREPPAEKVPSGSDELTGKLMALLIELRTNAKKAKDFAAADLIRNRLKDLGIALEDRPDGTEWSLN